MATPTGPTPEEAARKAQVQATDHAAVRSATPVGNVAGDIVKDVQAIEQNYQEAQPVVASVERAALPLGKEPAVVLGVGTGVVVAVLALTHVLDVSTATGFITSIAPLVGGFITRFVVKPV